MKTSTQGSSSPSPFTYGSWEIGGPRHYYRESLILRVLKTFLPPEGQTVLDVGCGTGSLLLRLVRAGYSPWGIDPSRGCIEVTRGRLKRLGLEARIPVLTGDALALPFPEGVFPGLVAAELLEHLEADQKAISEFYRVLEPGGIALVTVPAHPHLYDAWDSLAGHRRRYRQTELRARFEAAGFLPLYLHTWGFPLMRLYHRLLFLRWARRVARNQGQVDPWDTVTRLGLSRWVSLTLGTLFRVDDLFARLPWGIGMLLVARKPAS